MLPPPPRSTLFPYTTLFRSSRPRRATARSSRYTTWRWVACGGSSAPTYRRSRTRSSRRTRSEEHTSELQSQFHLVCRLLLEKKKKKKHNKNSEKTKQNKKDK